MHTPGLEYVTTIIIEFARIKPESPLMKLDGSKKLRRTERRENKRLSHFQNVSPPYNAGSSTVRPSSRRIGNFNRRHTKGLGKKDSLLIKLDASAASAGLAYSGAFLSGP
jgi:hypothetical protein